MPDTDVLARARSHRRIDGNESVSLWDAGDGVALLEIHTPAAISASPRSTSWNVFRPW
jgi:hypothetical protein